MLVEQERLKVLASQSDLTPKDRPLPEMVHWCRQQHSIVVLQNGVILCSDPASRQVQNCKIVMINKGLVPGSVYPATRSLIHMLLENAIDLEEQVRQEEGIEVSSQQQRLRILIKEALAIDASDIHLEVREHVARVRFRKHGELFLHAEWLPHIAREVASVAFNKETDHAVTHFNPQLPQNASMPLQLGEREVRLRLASLPAHGGFDVVMRILAASDDKIESIVNLGYTAAQLKLIAKAVNLPAGAVIMSGPTGSGKTTTLASCMELISDDRKIYTIEDPVEKVVDGVSQVPANTEHHDRGFASMARTVLRMDPDVIVLGEMRDEDTAGIMVRASITGHLVFSTLHTNSAAGIITRMNDLGISNSLLSSPGMLACLICQRLAPVLCEHCALPLHQSVSHQAVKARWQARFPEYAKQIHVRGQHACEHCQGLGIRGRTVIAEIIWVDEIGRRFIRDGDLLGWQAHLQASGWQSYADHLDDLVCRGMCDPVDAERLVGEIHG